MPPESQTVVILLWICVGLLLVLLLLAVAILRTVGRLGRTGRRGKTPEPERGEVADSAPPAVETSPGGAFEAFLEEDPSRREMPKGEQFKAYRKWRQRKGLNWSAP